MLKARSTENVHKEQRWQEIICGLKEGASIEMNEGLL
jgi:hypothetical protein